MIIDEEIKFFSAPGKVKLKPLTKRDRNNLCQNQLVIISYNYIIVIKDIRFRENKCI